MKIAILGGGVAGLSSAIALKQEGFDVSVYERHASPSAMGAGIVVWPNAAYVLDRLGVLDEIEAVSGRPTQMRRISSIGEDLGAVDIELINRRMGYPSLSVLRSDLQYILSSRLESLGISIHYAHKVARLETRSSREAQVFFQNGTTISADVIIGADGRMASCSRQYVNGESSPVYQGFVNWIGVYESEVDVFEEIAIADYWGVGERFGIVPVSKRKAYWAGGAARAEIGLRTSADNRDELQSVFSCWPRAVQRVIEGTPSERINKIYVHDHNPMATWHNRNVIVIGDAAHAPLPTSGQGACQALEDAWHLARCLKANGPDLERAFAEFTACRFEKTTGIIMAARAFAASLFNPDEDFCRARNERSKRTDFAQVAAAMASGWSQGLSLNA